MLSEIGQVIDFSEGGNAVEVMLSGWSVQEPDLVWTMGNTSTLALEVPRDAAFGFVLEFDWLPFIRKPWLEAQPVSISLNGRRVFGGDVRQDEVAGIQCPAMGSEESQMVITIEHPDAARPSDFGVPDGRRLALAVRRLRVLRLMEPPPVPSGRHSHIRLEATDKDSLAVEQRRITGMPVGELLTSFELLSGIDDLGVVQRQFDIEPAGLLPFDHSYPAASIRGLDRDFSAPDRMFVANLASSGLRGVLPLFLALTRQGPRSLLWVTTASGAEDAGLVREVLPGLFVGYLHPFARPMTDRVSLGGWLEVLVNMAIASGPKRAF